MERTRNLVKGLASIAQLVFSSITLYRTRGPQIQQYGYAAFGLSVFPYALMSLVNLVVIIIIGEYSTIFVLRTAILEEARRCGGRISGEIGTLPESLVDEDCSFNGMEIGNASEDGLGHVTPLPNSNDGGPEPLEKGEDPFGKANKTTTTGTPPEAKDKIRAVYDLIFTYIMIHMRRFGLFRTGEEKKDGSRAGELLIAAKMRVEDEVDGVLVIKMKGLIGRFKLIKNDDACDGNTFHFHVSPVTNQKKALKSEEKPVKFTHLDRWRYLFLTILNILPYVFIFLLTRFSKGNSTPAERGWMMSWVVFNQIAIFTCSQFSAEDNYFMASPWAAGFFIIILFICGISEFYY